MSAPDYDIAIIGAGPAGCAAALAFRGSGLRVILLDKKVFPRDKTCGDAIPGPAIRTLQQLLAGTGEDFSRFAAKQHIRTADIYTVGARKISIKWKLEACNSMRIHFDDYLLALVKRHTDVIVAEGNGLKAVQREGNWSLTDHSGRTIKARMIVGCDGAHSLTRKLLLPGDAPRLQQGVALRQYYKNVKTPSDCNEFFLFTEGGGGYFWIFPVGEGIYNTGIGISAQTHDKTDLRRLFKDLIINHPLVAPRLRDATPVDDAIGYRLPFGGSMAMPVSGDGFMLAGDAAFLVDPLQGHGIHTAMKSGMLAARQALICCSDNDFSAARLKTYDHAISTRIGKELGRNARLLRSLYQQPWIVEMSAVAARNKLVRKLVQAVF